jgi:uncharacterized damage-inducible protein DinB
MNVDEIKLMFEYNAWADRRVLAACTRVNIEAYGEGASFGRYHRNLQETVLHIVNSERSWRLICQGNPQVDWDEISAEEFPTPQSLEARWREEEAALGAYIGGLSDADLQSIVRYQGDDAMRERPLWQCLVHLFNHGTQHRGEAAAMLTMHGISAGDFDLTDFLLERDKR